MAARRLLHSLVRRANEQTGFLMVEVMVALMILLIGIVATFQLLDVSTRASYSAQRNQVAVNRAQREMETLRRLDFAQLSLNASPPTSSDPNHPGSRVSGSNFDLAKSPSVTDLAPLAIDGTNGLVSPGPDSFTDGKTTGKIYRYVVWRDDPGCAATCPGTEDYKRVIVAVKIDATGQTNIARNYTEVQSDFTNPHEGVLGEEAPSNPNPGETTTAQQFWLYDTTCEGDTRSEPSTGHAMHATTGDCGGSNPPDLMGTTVPSDSAPDDPLVPALYNYADDLTGGSEGLRMIERAGCDPTESDKYKIHRWATRAFAADFVMTGKASFVFHTRTTGASAPGTICVRLTRRRYSGGSPVSPDLTIATRDFSLNSWPDSDEWTALSFTTDFSTLDAADRTLETGDRLLLELFVDDSSEANLQFMYDHPDQATRLEVQTSTPLS